MLKSFLSTALLSLTMPILSAATATTTLQMIWPNDELGMDQAEAVQKAVTLIQSEDFANKVVLFQTEWKEKLADALGVNDYRNAQALASGLSSIVSVQGEPEHGVITISATTDDSELALQLAKRYASLAVNEARYKIAEKLDPQAASIAQQMETLEDDLQQLQSQLQLNAQMARTPAANSGANIGAPSNMGRVFNPGSNQRRAEDSTIQAQIQANRQQYNELRGQLQKAVNEAWQGQPRMGLMVIDQADLENEPAATQED